VEPRRAHGGTAAIVARGESRCQLHVGPRRRPGAAAPSTEVASSAPRTPRSPPATGDSPLPEQAARRALANDWFERAIRIGHAAKAVVFGGIGLLAGRLALGDTRETPDFPGTLEAISEQPLDVLFLTVLALGLFAYAAWRFAYGIADLDDAGDGLTGLAKRGVMFAIGFTYAGFGLYAVALLLGMRRDNDGIEQETATILSWPLGTWIVGAIGAGVVIAGLNELFVAFTARFREEFRNADLAAWEKGLVLAVGWWGHAARGAIYCAAGFFGIKAAVRYDPDEAKGFSDTLWEIGTGPMGTWLLLFIAAGLVAFGVYSLLLAIHRHIPDEGERRPESRLP
jgi:hypothetical protein